MTNSSNLYAWTRALVLVFAFSAFLGCGSKQRVEEREVQPPPTFDCISDRWAEPPPEVGQTPPDREPSALDVDPFVDETRQE